ncbi:MAG: DUF5627 domain-containing protein [Mariniphaga sp.]|jgi:hypothetical protein|nr:DUF5627 domain-containing protein [Mariniphaga sp.]
MKKLVLILLIATGMMACQNFDIDHPDFDYTSGYFPYQFPVRTLVLGDYIYDNSNDNDHKFVISVAMGGVYENTQNREFGIEVDESLCNRVLFSADGDTIHALPSNYYTLSDNNNIVIPAGKFNGGVEVQLTDAFFNDPLAIKNTYVVPVRITGSADVDTILVGQSDNPNADPRVAGQWIVAPKDFTMFAVKYINEFHGTYFHYGSSSVKDATNTVVENTTYSETYVENNGTAKLVTTGRNQVSLSSFLKSEVMTGEVNMVLTFNGNNCTITAAEGSPYTISGTGVFKSKEYAWGNKERDGIELSFSVSDGEHTYEANDVLVLRDRGVVLETYSPEVY